MRLAIVGATGMVGREMLEVLSERKFPLTELILVASEKSCGNLISFKGQKHKVISLDNLLKKEVDLALFSAGSKISKIWAPKLAEKGIKVVDNSSYWRMCSKYPLVIPEINGNTISKKDMIIANPNCSTIQLLMAIAPLHKLFKIERVVVSTYQAVSGTGKQAVEQLKNEQNLKDSKMSYPHKIFQNIIPQCDDFLENGYTKEEMKLTNETKKILDDNINVVATAVRVPVFRGHSESTNITFAKEFSLDEVKSTLQETEGLVVLDNLEKKEYPMPINTQKKCEVFVGRIRRDFTKEKSLNIWVVADNLRKGAATNTIQIAEYLIANKLLVK
tara:strand:+ start:12664 stop:13656 length:993 start_codon:yes stop_codon:yes gene_type:complete